MVALQTVYNFVYTHTYAYMLYSRGKQVEPTPFVRGTTPSLYWRLPQYIVPQLPRVVEGQCTLNYPACRLVIGCHRFLASDWSARGS